MHGIEFERSIVWPTAMSSPRKNILPSERSRPELKA